MNIGVVKETARCESRVALTPAAVRRLVENSNRVFIQRGAGERSHFPDGSYVAAGAEIAFSPAEVVDRCELLVKVGNLTREEMQQLHSHQAVMAWFHLIVADRDEITLLLDKRIAAIGYEVIEALDGRLPVLQPMSEIAGPMAVAVAGHLLRSTSGGRGILLGGAPGVAPARVLILGAGTVGSTAARTALNSGATTYVLDLDVHKLRRLLRMAPGAISEVSDAATVEELVPPADVLIGAVLVHGGLTPHLVSRQLVERMQPGSVIVDLSIDQGGCVETSRPTTLADPVFRHSDVLHYCVPNMTADIARTASAVLSQASLPYILALTGFGLEQALQRSPELARGVFTLWGECTNKALAERWSIPHREVSAMVGQQIRLAKP
jgi:alanine dehydrogenase